MADLEDKILRQNVPGRYSSWDDRGDARNEDSEGEADDEPSPDDDPVGFEQSVLEEQRSLAADNVPEPIRQQIAAKRLGEAKTGVKGVLADYREAKALEYFASEQEKLQRQQILTRMAEGCKMQAQADDDDDEDDFLKEYRQKRLAELQRASNLPVFGEVKEVGAFEFVDEVDHADPRICVCIHVFEPNQIACVRMNKHLQTIAGRQPHVKFLRMRASGLQQGIDHVALPMLMIYRGGKLLHVLARVQDEIGEAFGPDDVEWLLESHEVFDKPKQELEEQVVETFDSAAQASTAQHRLAAAADFDDDDDDY